MNDEKARKVLEEYAALPEYSNVSVPGINTRSLFGDYPINIAATRGLVDEVTVLLKNGADINAAGEHGYTPLHNAVEQGHIEIVKLLINCGANMAIMNEDGDSPIDLAILLKEDNIFKVFNKNDEFI
ncbi:MAG: ankyrin repeat domain-containing protein [Alcanivorax sp.]|nr:ankyrin repeat domain-containing protein [Alcanivorax sp.]